MTSGAAFRLSCVVAIVVIVSLTVAGSYVKRWLKRRRSSRVERQEFFHEQQRLFRQDLQHIVETVRRIDRTTNLEGLHARVGLDTLRDELRILSDRVNLLRRSSVITGVDVARGRDETLTYESIRRDIDRINDGVSEAETKLLPVEIRKAPPDRSAFEILSDEEDPFK